MSLRHRPTSLTDSHRRNSTLSDTVSEARNSIRSSTDDLFFPRVIKRPETESHQDDESLWQSAPLALALFPAIAGVFFHNGSAVVTDITLLVLAAIFLNWSVRLPWDWYHSAQALRQQDNNSSKYYDAAEIQSAADAVSPVSDAAEAHGDAGAGSSSSDSSREGEPLKNTAARAPAAAAAAAAAAEASRELHIHELVALASCFILPMIGTWLLHTIRSKLSRPSEGLVSNYNLTIFLLASEIRPFAHLLKMVQARTLHLQRIVSSSSSSTTETLNHNTGKIAEISTRLDELEAHVASKAVDSPSPSPGPTPTPTIADLRKAIQPDIDALNRAVRRYEKRSAVTSFQTDSRLRDLEAQARDALALAAAAQRADSLHRPGLLRMGLNCFYAVWAIPVQIALGLVYLPLRVLVRCVRAVMAALVSGERGRVFKGKSPQPQPQSQSRSQRESGSRSRSLRPGQRSGSGVRGVEEPIPEYE